MLRFGDIKESYIEVNQKTRCTISAKIVPYTGISINRMLYEVLLEIAVNAHNKNVGRDGFEIVREPSGSYHIEVISTTKCMEGDYFSASLGRSISKAKAKKMLYNIQRNLCRHVFSLLHNIGSECVYSGVMAEDIIDGESKYIEKHLNSI